MVNPNTGRLTFARNRSGDYYFDDRAIYPVFATLYAQKTKYLFDDTVGTFLFKIKSDVRATGTRLVSAATDALDQVQTDGLIQSGYNASADRIANGRWAIIMRWKSPNGEAVTQPLRL